MKQRITFHTARQKQRERINAGLLLSPFLYNPGLTEKGVMPPMVDMSSHLNRHNKENPMLLPKSQPNIDCHSSRLTFYTFMVV